MPSCAHCCTLLLCLVFSAHPLRAANADGPGDVQLAAIEKLVEKFAKTGGTGENFCWQAAFHLRAFEPGYRASHDRRWLDQGVKASDLVFAAMQPGPDGYKGWVGRIGDSKSPWTDVVVGDAVVCDRLLGIAELILTDPALTVTYGETARRYLAIARRDLIEKWDARGIWHEDGAYGAYVQWDMYSTGAEPTRWQRVALPENGVSLPFNKQNSVGECLLKIYRITGESVYRERAQRIYAFMKSRMQLSDDCYVWNYWEPFGPWDVDVAKQSASLWMGTHPFRNYQDAEIRQIVDAYNTGVVFEQQDIQRIINTNLKIMWNQDRVEPHFANSNSRIPGNPLTPEQRQAKEEEKAKNPYAKGGAARAGCLWSDLAPFDQTVRELFQRQLATTTGSEKILFEQVTMATPPGFARLHAQLPVTTFERPWSSCHSLTVASMLPSTVSATRPAVLLCKASRDVDLTITVRSADGEHHLGDVHRGALAGGKDGRAGVLMLTWDAAILNSKQPLALGSYRIRWTVPDGYREFPIVIAH